METHLACWELGVRSAGLLKFPLMRVSGTTNGREVRASLMVNLEV